MRLFIVLSLLFHLSAIVANELQALPEKTVVDCDNFQSTGCLITPSGYKSSEGKLIVFIRGFWGDYKGHVPEEKLVDSANQISKKFRLFELAVKTGSSVLVIASSNLSLTEDILARVESETAKQLNKPSHHFNEITLAAHSGAYVGLMSSIDLLLNESTNRLNKIIMLDSYYTSKNESIANAVKKGHACVGFLTQHNKSRFDTYYQPIGCISDGPEGYKHSDSVPACLEQYLYKDHCEPTHR